MLKEIEEQIKEFNKLIKKYPAIDELYIGRAVLYAKIGEYEKAIKDYEKAHEDYIYDIIAVCLRKHLTGEIERLYKSRINRDKSNIVNYMGRARFYMSQGEDEKALTDCETILKLCPNIGFILEMKKVLIKEIAKKQARNKRAKTPPILRA